MVDLSAYEASLVPLESEVGQMFLSALVHDACLARFLHLVDAYEQQEEPSWCALAAIRMALKSDTSLASTTTTLPTQRRLYELATEWRAAQRMEGGQFRAGVSLLELEALLGRLFREQLRVRRRVMRRDSSGDQKQFMAALCDDLDAIGSARATTAPLLVVNVLRHVQGHWTGHWMVVGARASVGGENYVLLLDPAAHKLGPHWLPQEILAATMRTVNSRGEARGYLAISHSDEHDADHGDLHQGAWHQAAPPAAQPHDRF